MRAQLTHFPKSNKWDPVFHSYKYQFFLYTVASLSLSLKNHYANTLLSLFSVFTSLLLSSASFLFTNQSLRKEPSTYLLSVSFSHSRDYKQTHFIGTLQIFSLTQWLTSTGGWPVLIRLIQPAFAVFLLELLLLQPLLLFLHVTVQSLSLLWLTKS